MIENEQHYRVTQARLAEFEDALAHGDDLAHERHPLLQKALRSGIEGEIQILRTQIRDYERLSRGDYVVIELDSLADLGEVFVGARNSLRLSQKELAARLDVDVEQVERFEATRYAEVGPEQAQAVADALGVSIHLRVLCPAELTQSRERTPVK